MTAVKERDAFITTLDHIERAGVKIAGMLGKSGSLTFPDQHKLSEGLFLSAWTHWEEFIRSILVSDLADDPQGFVRKDVSKFRVKGAARRIAARVLFHPDHPDKFVEWDYAFVKSRADNFLPANHRFTNPLPHAQDLEKLKRVRNAIAHKSDRAWDSFIRLVKDQPFALTGNQCRGLSVGRFLCAHNWNNKPVLRETMAIHRANARHLVP